VINNDKFLKTLTNGSVSFHESSPPKFQWEFYSNDRTTIQYSTKIFITDKKHLFFILTKKRISDNTINIYMNVYLTSIVDNNVRNVKHPYDVILDIVPEGLLSNYRYVNIKSLYLSSHPDLFKLYGIVKFGNVLNHQGKPLFIDNMLKWTKIDSIPWVKNSKHFYKCYDIENKNGPEIIIKVGKTRIFITLEYSIHNPMNRIFALNNIHLSNTKLFDEISKQLGNVEIVDTLDFDIDDIILIDGEIEYWNEIIPNKGSGISQFHPIRFDRKLTIKDIKHSSEIIGDSQLSTISNRKPLKRYKNPIPYDGYMFCVSGLWPWFKLDTNIITKVN